MAKKNHKSRAEIMREALQAKAEYEEYKRKAITEGISIDGNSGTSPRLGNQPG